MFVQMLDYQRRVELIQDLWFETATTKIKATPDGEFLIASGVLKFDFIILFKIFKRSDHYITIT